jgi:ketosteroid isomerase-like protein
MSQDTVELVGAGMEAVLRGDFEYVESFMHPDAVLVQPPEVPDSKSYQGPNAIREAMEDWPQQWDDFSMELLEIVDVGDDVAVSVTRHTGHGRESGIEMDAHLFYVHHLPEGKLARLEMYFSREQALESARRLA